MIRQKRCPLINPRFYEALVHAANGLKLLGLHARLRKSQIRSFAPILVYHRVGDLAHPWSLVPTSISAEVFEQQIKYMCHTYRILPLDQLVWLLREKQSPPQRVAAITFDDGYKCIHRTVYPILKKYDLPAKVFLPTSFIETGKLFWWDTVGYAIHHARLTSIHLGKIGRFLLQSRHQRSKVASVVVNKLKHIPDQEKRELIDALVRQADVEIPTDLGKELILSWQEIKEMAEYGVTFGAHTCSHTVLTQIPTKQAREEIQRSKERIEEMLGRPVTAFAYPNGGPDDFNPEVIDLVKECGFTYAVTAIPRMAYPGADPYQLGRIMPEFKPECTLDQFKLMLLASQTYTDMVALMARVKGRR